MGLKKFSKDVYILVGIVSICIVGKVSIISWIGVNGELTLIDCLIFGCFINLLLWKEKEEREQKEKKKKTFQKCVVDQLF